MTEALYCFRCGDPFTTIDGCLYCSRGDMGLSPLLTELLVAAAAVATRGETLKPVENSSFRCVRCRTFMRQMDKIGLIFQCPDCSMHYSKQITYNMVERHGHAKWLEPGQSALCSVIVIRERDAKLIPERLAERLQHTLKIPGHKAWQLTEELQKVGQVLLFTGHPQDAVLVASGLMTEGIRVELVET